MKKVVRKKLLTGKKIDIDLDLLDKEEENPYCLKGIGGCYCKVGRPENEICPDCKDDRKPNDEFSKYCYCICSPLKKDVSYFKAKAKAKKK